MKKIMISLLIMIAFVGVQCGSEDVATAPAKYNLRDIGPGGGYVFYDKGYYSDGWRYLEAASADQSTSIRWSDSMDAVGTGTAIGTGKNNTALIVAKYPSETNAASLCNSYTSPNGTTGWFLPSKDELYEMCWVLHSMKYSAIDNPTYDSIRVGGFANACYWSSSDYNIHNAWFQSFTAGGQGSEGKNDSRRVRAVRAF